LVDKALYPILDALLLFYFVDQLRLITAALPLLSRVILVAEMAGATLFLIWLIRSKHWSGEAHAASGFARLVRVVLRLGLVIFPATFLASVLGYVNLANLLGNGALKSAYVAAALYAAFRIVEGLIIIALLVRPLALSRVVRLHRSLLQRRLCGIARFLAVLMWLSLTLKFFALQDSLMKYGGAALEAKLTIGFLNISLGQVLVFIVTVWTSLLVSRFVRFLLEEDVYHHWRVERGIPQAISTMVHYTVLLVGLFVALAVLGVDLTKITILAGAFTVGIGFGLHTVIKLCLRINSAFRTTYQKSAMWCRSMRMSERFSGSGSGRASSARRMVRKLFCPTERSSPTRSKTGLFRISTGPSRSRSAWLAAWLHNGWSKY
jgi:small-conductance mechanosensitive channel